MKTTSKTLFQNNPKRNQLLDSFEKEYREAIGIDTKGNGYELPYEYGSGATNTDKVLDKYMDMETNLFDSDDLNEIVDKIEGV